MWKFENLWTRALSLGEYCLVTSIHRIWMWLFNKLLKFLTFYYLIMFKHTGFESDRHRFKSCVKSFWLWTSYTTFLKLCLLHWKVRLIILISEDIKTYIKISPLEQYLTYSSYSTKDSYYYWYYHENLENLINIYVFLYQTKIS